ncbi:MAG: hypothetical protein PUB26_03520 [Mycoplasmataceae bacterium]|nr:hypothetical protein [Mycoplasmataceae bacterium]
MKKWQKRFRIEVWKTNDEKLTSLAFYTSGLVLTHMIIGCSEQKDFTLNSTALSEVLKTYQEIL